MRFAQAYLYEVVQPFCKFGFVPLWRHTLPVLCEPGAPVCPNP